jgi:hypothetical protein
VYRDRWQHPDDSDEAALSRVLFGGNMTADRASELAELHALVSRRVALLAKRGGWIPRRDARGLLSACRAAMTCSCTIAPSVAMTALGRVD